MVRTGRVSLLHVLLVFIVVFFNLYSFSLPMTLAVDVVVLLCVWPAIGNFRIGGNKAIKNIILSAVLLGVYTLIICVINGSSSMYTLGKPLRFVFTLIVFSIISIRFASYGFKELFIGILLALFLHLTFVYLEFFVPSLKAVVYSYLDGDKEDIINLPLRAFGLCTSFDGAGMILCMLEVMLWLISREKKSWLMFLLCLMTYVGCFMVGRTAMLVSTVFMVMIVFSYGKKNKAFLFFFIIPVFIIAGSYVYNLAQGILSENIIEQSYRVESSEKLTGEMLYLPETLFGRIFGTGERALLSDIGYVNQIFMVGYVGMLWILSIYYQTYLCARRFRKNYSSISLFFIIILVLLLIYNYKLSFLYSRSVSDVYFLMLFVMLRKQADGRVLSEK